MWDLHKVLICPLILFQRRGYFPRGTWQTSPPRSRSIYLWKMMLWKMYILVQIVLLDRFPNTLPYLNNYATYSPGHTRRFQNIDPSIVEHEIRTSPNVKPIRKNIRPINPWKEAAIKAEVEKLLKAGFIYPISLIEWVSNLVPVDKKQGNIRVYTYF